MTYHYLSAALLFATPASAANTLVPPALDAAQVNSQSATVLKERQKLDEKSAVVGSVQRPEEDLSKPQPSALAVGPQGQSVPMVDLPPPVMKSGPYTQASENPAFIPVVHEAPKPGLSAWLGQTLVLRASASPKQAVAEPTTIAWVLNGAVVCWGESCRIPLDGKLIGPGLSSLVVAAYNPYGSTLTRHAIRVIKGYWNPTMPFSDKHVREENAVPVSTMVPVVNRQALWGQMLEGNAVQAYPETVNVLGAVPTNFSWNGEIKTSPRGTLKITDENQFRWYFLGNSSFQLATDPGGQRTVRLSRGTARAHLPRQEKVKDQVLLLETRELQLRLTPGSDALVWAIPPPAKVLLKRRQTKPKTLKKSEQYQTKVVLISGVGQFKTAKSAKDAPFTEFPSGVELTVYEDGTVTPLARPDGQRMEAALKRTMSATDLADLAKKKEAAKAPDFNLAEHMKKVEELAEREEFFEVLSELALVADREKEDVRIAYFQGLANKGLYQPKAAEEWFHKAMAQQSDFADAPWQLGLMYLDDKKWTEAAEAFDASVPNLPNGDKRIAEYEYYAGVARFQTGADFRARNHFTRAVLWHPDLEQTLKGSAAEFMKKLRSKKAWNAVVPLGFQFDGNPLGLQSGQALPQGYSSRQLFRLLSGLMFNWDPAGATDDPGTYHGWGASVMYAKHFPNSFKAFDTLILGGNITQTLRTKGEAAPTGDGKPQQQPESPPAPPNILKLTESISIPLVKNKPQSATLSLNANYDSLDGTLGVEYDIAGESHAKRHALTGRESYPIMLWETETGQRLDLEISADQRLALKKSDQNGHSIGLGAAPGFQYPFTALTSSKVSVPLGVSKSFAADKALSIKATPTLGLNIFLTPWLMSTNSFSYEINRQTATGSAAKTVRKLSATLMLSGVL